MPTIQINPTQGKRFAASSFSGAGTDWNSIHDGTTATMSDQDANFNIWASFTSAFGFTFHYINRYANDFDLSGLPAGATITAATLNLYGNSWPNTDVNFHIIEGTFDSSLAADDFNNFTGYASGWDGDDVTDYADEVTTGDWDETDFNEITLNSTAITALQSAFDGGTRFKVMYMTENDYEDTSAVAGGSGVSLGVEWHTIGNADSAKHPYLEITYTAAALLDGPLALRNGKLNILAGRLVIK